MMSSKLEAQNAALMSRACTTLTLSCKTGICATAFLQQLDQERVDLMSLAAAAAHLDHKHVF